MNDSNPATGQGIKARHLCFQIGVLTAVLMLADHAPAQMIYRIVGPDGKISFSDKPPSATDKSSVTAASSKSSADTGVALPFELRQVVSRYPVTLYTGNNCAPCGSGRSLLSARGIPFTEKTVTSAEDSAALQRISGENSLPFLTIGTQQIKGFSDAEWTQFLTAAGYPVTSLLPASHHNPSAVPLVTLQKPTPVVKPDDTPAQRAPAPVIPPPVDTQSNPAGIKF